MMSARNSGALIAGAPRQGGIATVKAKILRGVFVRGKPYPPGAIVELTMGEFNELKSARYCVAATKEDVEAPPPAERMTLHIRKERA